MMRAPAPHPEAVARAKADGLHLVSMVIDGKPAKRGGMSFAGAVGPKALEKVHELFRLLANADERGE